LDIKGELMKAQIDCVFSSTCGNDISRSTSLADVKQKDCPKAASVFPREMTVD
jgi:hypothetical protein